MHQPRFARIEPNQIALAILDDEIDIILMSVRPCGGDKKLGLRIDLAICHFGADENERYRKHECKTQKRVEQNIGKGILVFLRREELVADHALVLSCPLSRSVCMASARNWN